MGTKTPERLSFHEIKEALSNTSRPQIPLRFIGRDVAMLRSRHDVFGRIIKKGTPYIVEDIRLGYVMCGQMRIVINLVEHVFTKGTMAYVGTGSIIELKEMSDDFDLCGMMLAPTRLRETAGPGIPSWVTTGIQSFVVKGNEADLRYVSDFMDLLWKLFNRTDMPDKAFNGLIYSLLWYYDDIKTRNDVTGNAKTTRTGELFDRFFFLFNNHCRHERAIAFYADKMCITPRYLGAAVKAASGITAKQWIDRAVTANAKVMMKYGSGQVADVAYGLGFPNVSFFCKFFKRATGLTPMEYRNNVDSQQE